MVIRWVGIGATVLAIALLTGCGGDDDIGSQNERVAEELFDELDSAAFETEFDAPSDVECVRPRPGRFRCVAYVRVADDVALTAEYRVVDCEFGWRALAIDAHRSLSVPAKVAHDREVDTGCAWADSGSFLDLEDG